MRTASSRFSVITLGIAAAVALHLSAPPARAGAPARYGLWDRFTFDWGYELALVRKATVADAYARDPATERRAAAFVVVNHDTAAHGIVLDVAFSIAPEVSLGLDASVRGDLSTPSPDPWLDRVGVRYGPRRTLGLGVMAEFRPWKPTYAPREGVFLRTGIRPTWTDYRLAKSPQVVSPSDGYHNTGAMLWGGVGYRLALGAGLSFHAQAHVGMEADLTLVGIRMGGGFH